MDRNRPTFYSLSHFYIPRRWCLKRRQLYIISSVFITLLLISSQKSSKNENIEKTQKQISAIPIIRDFQMHNRRSNDSDFTTKPRLLNKRKFTFPNCKLIMNSIRRVNRTQNILPEKFLAQTPPIPFPQCGRFASLPEPNVNKDGGECFYKIF